MFNFPPLDVRSVPCIVVEDDYLIRSALCAMLADIGVEALECADVDGLEALLSAHQPQIIFLDIGLRGCDALDVFELLSARRYGGALQLVSGYDAAILKHTRLAGETRGLRMRAPIAKPFWPDDIRTILTEECLLAGRRTTAAELSRRAGKAAAIPLPVRRQWIDPKTGRTARTDLCLPDGEGTGTASLSSRIAHWQTLRGRSARKAEAFDPVTSLVIRSRISDLAPAMIPAMLGDAGAHDGRPPLTLCFTEDDVFSNLAAARPLILKLRIHEVRVRIENCGTRYLGMAGLEALPAHEIVLSHQPRGEPTGAAIGRFKAITQIAHAAGVSVMAEAPALPSDVRWLAETGFDLCRPTQFTGQRSGQVIQVEEPRWRRIRLGQLAAHQKNQVGPPFGP